MFGYCGRSCCGRLLCCLSCPSYKSACSSCVLPLRYHAPPQTSQHKACAVIQGVPSQNEKHCLKHDLRRGAVSSRSMTSHRGITIAHSTKGRGVGCCGTFMVMSRLASILASALLLMSLCSRRPKSLNIVDPPDNTMFWFAATEIMGKRPGIEYVGEKRDEPISRERAKAHKAKA